MRLRPMAPVVAVLAAVFVLAGCGSDGGGSPFGGGSTPPSTGSSGSGSAPGPSTGDVPNGTKVTTSDFSVTLPDGYSEDKSKTSSIIVAFYRGPEVDGSAVNVNVTRESAGGASLQDFYTRSIASLKQALQIRNLSSPANLSIDGEQALRYYFEDTQGGIELKQGQVLVIHNGNGYVLTYTARTEHFDEQSTKAVQLILSLRWN